MLKTTKKWKVFLILICMLLSTGCTQVLKDGDKKPVKNPETGQSLTENILCKPTDPQTIETYQTNGVDLENLPDCTEFKINSGKYDGLWTTIFVKPLAFCILALGNLVKSYGLSLIIVSLIIRLIAYPITRKTAMQSELLKNAQPEINRIEKKYEGKSDQDSLMKKSQELMMVYKKYSISPFGSCLLAFIQLPLFFAFLQAINRTPAIFEGHFLGFTLGRTPMVGLFQYHEWAYIVIILLTILTTYLSFKNAMSASSTGNPEMERQMQFTFKFMIVMISVASLYLSTAIALYWVATNGFVVLQNYLFKKLDEREEKKDSIIKPQKDNKKKRGK